MMKVRTIILTLITLCTVSFTVQAANPVTELDFYAISDLRGTIRAEENIPGIAKLAGVVEELRAQNPQGTVLLGGGNMIFGTLESNRNVGRPMVAAMNAMKFDADVIGTNLFDLPPQIFTEQLTKAHFPYVSCAVVPKTGKDAFKKYVIVQRKGIKIGIIGVTTPRVLREANPSNLEHFQFLDPYLEAPAAIRAARAAGAQVIVALLHSQLKVRAYDGGVRGEAIRLLSQLKGVDICFAGSGQEVVNGKYLNIPVLQTGNRGRYIAHVRLGYDASSRKVLSAAADMIDVGLNSAAPDAALAEMARPVIAEIDQQFGDKLCVNMRPLTNDKFEQSSLAEYFTDRLRLAFGADIAFINGGAFAAPIPAGSVTARQVEAAYPYMGKVVLLTLKGSDILDALDFGVDNQQIGQGRFSGIRLALEPDMPRHRRILDSIVGSTGQPLDPDRVYTVVTNDFLANGGDGFTMFKKALSRKEVAPDIKAFFRQALRQAGTIDYVSDRRWSVGKIRY